jgi:hypothetical protein
MHTGRTLPLPLETRSPRNFPDRNTVMYWSCDLESSVGPQKAYVLEEAKVGTHSLHTPIKMAGWVCNSIAAELLVTKAKWCVRVSLCVCVCLVFYPKDNIAFYPAEQSHITNS